MALVAVFHFIRQQYGFMRIYSRFEPKGFGKKLDGLIIYSATIYPMIFWFFTPRKFTWFVENEFNWMQNLPNLLPVFTGIYLFIDENDEVIYIGETTHFGNRFGSYFSSKIENLLKHNWNSNPHFVIPIKVPTESSFERLGLEEYLIKKTNPIDNKRFNN